MLAAQDAGKEAVERAAPKGLRQFGSHNGGDALVHFTRRLVRKCERHDAPRRYALFQEVGNLIGQHPRLARPCSSHYEQRPVVVGDGFELGCVERLCIS